MTRQLFRVVETNGWLSAEVWREGDWKLIPSSRMRIAGPTPTQAEMAHVCSAGHAASDYWDEASGALERRELTAQTLVVEVFDPTATQPLDGVTRGQS